MLYPSLENAQRLLKSYRTVPVFSSLLMDCRTPVGIFSALKNSCENCFLLESAEQSERWGRYSFIGLKPRAEIVIRDGEAVFTENGLSRTEKIENPVAYLSPIMEEYRSPRFSGYPVFTGGLVGYFGYDLLRYKEKSLGAPPPDDLNMPDCVLHLYDEVVAFNHLNSRVYIILNLSAGSDVKKQYEACEARAAEIAGLIAGAPEAAPSVREKSARELRYRSNVTPGQYAAMVLEAKKHIFAGDIFQVVPSRRLEIENPPDPFRFYRVLRSANPSPYLYFIQSPEYQIAGASPEMLVRVENRVVTNKPIAGTSPRGKDEAEDKRLEQALLSDEKERAEHTMLVDLGRNDVGRVCEFGTVEVRDFMHVERYSKVMHLVSEVRGVLRPDQTPLDALLSVLPAGTLTGAPKLRAMQIIDELENRTRGVYGGAIGYLGFNGDINTCIAIRTALFRGGKAYVQAGGGVVADSVPEKEYQETANKASALLHAFEEAYRL